MDDPLPGRIARDFGPGARASLEWEAAAQASLATLYRTAVRPLWGPAPSTAAAVLFSDYGELLACLASDLASGTALGWWWKTILRGSLRPLPGSWAAAWENEPLYVPAALHYLEGQNRAVDVLERIAPAQAWNLLMAVLHAFDLSGLMMRHGGNGGERPKPSAPATPLSEVPPENAATRSPTSAAQRPPASSAASVPFPWEPHILRASTPPELGYERQALLGIGLLLHRVPQVAFHATFGLRFRAWVSGEEAAAQTRAEDSLPFNVPHGLDLDRYHAIRGETLASTSQPDILAKHGLPEARSLLPHPRRELFESRGQPHSHEVAGSPSRPSFQPEAGLPGVVPTSSSASVRPSTAEKRERTLRDSGPGVQARSSTPTEATRGDRKQREAALDKMVLQTADNFHSRQSQMAEAPVGTVPSALARTWEDGELTCAGGILYLVHFLRGAGLLREFDAGLSGWALLELVARCLLDDNGELADDAIWTALAQLDGRDPLMPPGLAFRPQLEYAAPRSWQEDAAERPRFVRFRSRGFEIWSSEGFLLLDSEEGVPPSGAVRRLKSSRRRGLRQVARVRPLSLSLSPELRRFLHFVMPYARWRLGRALRWTFGSAGRLPKLLLQDVLLRKGRIHLSSTHVDLVMPMSEISVPVRMAGLDANPGWVPELGRVVTFHFV
jgi:hypothetical protein